MIKSCGESRLGAPDIPLAALVLGLVLASSASAGTFVNRWKPAAPQHEPAADAWAGRTWQAYSAAAMSSTGNLTTSADAIIFQNGERLTVRFAKDGVEGKLGFSPETRRPFSAAPHKQVNKMFPLHLSREDMSGQAPVPAPSGLSNLIIHVTLVTSD